MSKAVMISIQPKWCELIARNLKNVEIRKTRPKLEPPFKCYIYQTQPKKKLLFVVNEGGKKRFVKKDDDGCHMAVHPIYKAYGKVIGEFVCDDITGYEAEFCKGNDLYESIQKVLFDEDGYEYRVTETANDNDNPDDCELLRNAAMTFQQLKDYANLDGFGKLYGWHISDLVIYDKPKELSEFKKHNRLCHYEHLGLATPKCSECKECQLERPPQSWCYVEEA